MPTKVARPTGSDLVPTIPIKQQSLYPGGQRAAAAKPAGPDNQGDTSANGIRGPPRLWDRASVRRAAQVAVADVTICEK